MQRIATDKAPGAIGPYSQGVAAAGLVFASGQIGLDPATGEMAAGVEAQTRQALTNARAVLEAAGSGLDRAVKTTVFLADMDDFAVMNAVYAEFFDSAAYPARSAVQVARLPKGALVEIEVIGMAG